MQYLDANDSYIPNGRNDDEEKKNVNRSPVMVEEKKRALRSFKVLERRRNGMCVKSIFMLMQLI